MKKIIPLLFLFVSFKTFSNESIAPVPSSTPPSIVGEWKTIDDKSKSERAIIEIFERDGKFFGRIKKTFPKPDDKTTCEKCKGEEKDKPIVGLEILKNVTKEKSDPQDLKWSGGTILDPENGENYKVNLEILDNGQKLKVRGYIGFSFIGRTQNWYRP
jgi:uncharacterized protein (DUF2147 family)